MAKPARIILGLLAFAGAAALASEALAGTVSGVLLSPEGAPIASRQVHFKNVVTGDVFLTGTGPNGAFSVRLPAGDYELRDEEGVKGLAPITVADVSLDLGSVREPGRWSLSRWLGGEVVGDSLVKSPAPAAARLATGRMADSELETISGPAKAPKESGSR